MHTITSRLGKYTPASGEDAKRTIQELLSHLNEGEIVGHHYPHSGEVTRETKQYHCDFYTKTSNGYYELRNIY